MIAAFQPILHRLSTLIDGFQPADGPPPDTLWPFIRWCLAGAWPVILLATLLSALAGVMEVGAAWLLGVLVDSTLSGTEGYFAANFGLQLAVFLALRARTSHQVALSIIAGNRNVALFLVALPAATVDALLPFIACYQFPMYLTPLLLGWLHTRSET